MHPKERLLFSFAMMALLFSCTTKRESPEDVLAEYCEALKEGNCEKIKDLSSPQGIELMTDWLALGCEPIQTTVDSIYCNTSDSVAYCTCYETRANHSMNFEYFLEKIDDEWKVTPPQKDMPMTGDSWDRPN